jgi:hypothetical protein
MLVAYDKAGKAKIQLGTLPQIGGEVNTKNSMAQSRACQSNRRPA